MIEIIDSQDLLVRNLSVVEAPAYSIRFYRSDRVRAENITIRNHPKSPNTDGIQIRDTSNAFIRGADIDTGDDAIVLKSYGRMIENVIVTDSILKSDDSALKFGTAGYVGIQNTLFSNIIIRDSRYGIALFQMDGGLYKDNRFHNIQIATGGRALRPYAVYVDIDRRREDAPWGKIEGLSFSEIDSVSTANWLIAGNSNSTIKDLTLRNVSLRVPAPAIDLSKTARKPRGNTLLTPLSDTEDYSAIPAHFTLANIDRLTMEGVSIRALDESSIRAGVWLKAVTDGHVEGVTLRSASASPQPVVRALKSPDVRFDDLQALGQNADKPVLERLN
jgi:hypothetical protein